MSLAALETYLTPFKAVFDQEDVNEIIVNQPHEFWVEKKGIQERCEAQDLDLEHLLGLGRLIAQSTQQKISTESPLLSATLPNGYRIQVVFPPAALSGTVALSIRKNNSLNMSLGDYSKLGVFDKMIEGKNVDNSTIALNNYLKEKNFQEFIRHAIIHKKNFIISGGTSTGKTSFANAILSEIPEHERLVTVEDTHEIILHKHPNKLHLLSSRGGQSVAKITAQSLIEACLRLRPDRIIVGELRGVEAFSFLRAINTGHPGSVSTIHADNTQMAIEQIKLMVLQSGVSIPMDELTHYITSTIDIIVQLKKDGGKRFISDIYYKDQINN